MYPCEIFSQNNSLLYLVFQLVLFLRLCLVVRHARDLVPPLTVRHALVSSFRVGVHIGNRGGKQADKYQQFSARKTKREWYYDITFRYAEGHGKYQ